MAQKLAYLGPAGTFTEEAAKLYNTSSMETVAYPTINGVFNAVNNGEVAVGIIPIENSIEGAINITLDLLAGQHQVKIAGEVILNVNLNLIARSGVKLSDVTKVLSIPVAVAQCRQFLQQKLPDIETVETNSTADAAHIVANSNEPWAAIANITAAKLNVLDIIADSIQDCQENKTRFIVLSKEDAPLIAGSKTSVIISITDRPGGLYQLLKEFALRNVNLTKIDSRPAKKSLGDYVFYIELMGHRLEPKVAECLKAIQDQVAFIKVLGSYPAAEIALKDADAARENKWSLEQIREDIDIIDYQIVDLLAQRTRLVNMVGQVKKNEKKIKDSKREEEVIQRLKNIAVDKGFDPDITEKIYRQLFDHFVSLQEKIK